jgi:tetratricopeptide (TPR) repeat protein
VRAVGQRLWTVVCLGLAVATACPASPALANARSQALYSRGLVPFNRGQWEQAYALFDQAVEADPGDPVALYYRGLAEARRGMEADAIRDFEAALKLDPKLPHAALDLGIAYFDTTQYVPAKSWLEQARQQPGDRFAAALFLGLTEYRLGDYAGAVTYLNEAKADPELRGAASYYAGLALLKQGDTAGARAEMTEVAREQPQTEMGRAAQAYLAGGAAPALATKPWSVYGGVSFGYDSNVVIGPSNSDFNFNAIGIGQQGDGFALLQAGGAYRFLDTDWGSLTARYDFYQSIHFDLTQFDLQGDRFQLDAVSRPGRVTYGLYGAYDLYLLNYQTFFQEGIGIPWVALAEGDRATTQVYYRIRGRDFFRGPFDPGRDGFGNAFGLGQLLSLGEPGWLLNGGYQFDAEDTVSNGPQGKDFQYNANEFTVEVTAPRFWETTVRAGYMFRLEDYQFPNSRVDFAFRRHDHANQVALGAVHELTPNVALTLDYIGVFNGSNIADFVYTRNIVQGGVRVMF